jgi:hypothetical protein
MRMPAAFLATLLLWVAAPLAAQVTPPDTTAPAPGDTILPAPPDTMPIEAPMPPDTLAIEAPVPADTLPPAAVPAPGDTAAVTAPAPPDTLPPQATHDWEFSLTATGRVTDVNGRVLVTEGEPANTFDVEVTGLPPVDTLDEEGRDLAAYTVWLVPSKERVRESSLAGTLDVAADGTGRLSGLTELDTFGIIVMASGEGVTELSGVPILTGIPVTQAEVPSAAPTEETPAAGENVPEPAPEVPQQPAPPPPDRF